METSWDPAPDDSCDDFYAEDTASSTTAPKNRAVLHLDVDNFYVAVECADNPYLVNSPIAVTQGNSGGFVALSAEAKAAGLRKGDGVGDRGRAAIPHLVEMGSMSIDECRRRCPGLIVLPMRTTRYREAGAQMLRALEAACGGTGEVVPMEKTSYDDVYLDVTTLTSGFHRRGESSVEALPRVRAWSADGEPRPCLVDTLPDDLWRACQLANELRRALASGVGLTASVGVGRSKLVARMLSPLAKPDGVLCVADALVPIFMSRQPIRKLPGLQQKRGREISAALEAALHHHSSSSSSLAGNNAAAANGLTTLGHVQALAPSELSRCIGAADAALLRRCLAGDDGDAKGVQPRGLQKTISSEVSFPPTEDLENLRQTLRTLSAILISRLRAAASERASPPAKLVVTWREGYVSSAQGGGGIMHSLSTAWPPQLGLYSSMRRSSSTAAASTSSGGLEAAAAIDENSKEHDDGDAEALVGSAMSALVARLPRMPPLTRLVVAADFGKDGGGAKNAAASSSFLNRWMKTSGGSSSTSVMSGNNTGTTGDNADGIAGSSHRPEASGTHRGCRTIAQHFGRMKRDREGASPTAPAKPAAAGAGGPCDVHLEWTCESCTFCHDTERNCRFLNCEMCGRARAQVQP